MGFSKWVVSLRRGRSGGGGLMTYSDIYERNFSITYQFVYMQSIKPGLYKYLKIISILITKYYFYLQRGRDIGNKLFLLIAFIPFLLLPFFSLLLLFP